MENLERQLNLENEFKSVAEDYTRRLIEKDKANERLSENKAAKSLVASLIKNLRNNYKTFLMDAVAPKRGVKPSYCGYLSEMEQTLGTDVYLEFASTISVIVVSNVINKTITASKTFTANISVLAKIVGCEVQEEYNLQRFEVLHADKVHDLEVNLPKRVGTVYRKALVDKIKDASNYKDVVLDNKTATMLGLSLLDIMMSSTSLFEYVQVGTGSKGIGATQKLIEWLKTNEDSVVLHSYRFCPTVIPPKPWTDFYNGGYYGALAPAVHLLRTSGNSVWVKNYIKRLNQLELAEVRRAVNGIQSTPWQINKEVLSVLNELVSLGGGMAGLPYFEEAPKPAILKENFTAEDLALYKRKMIPYYKNETRRKSIALRCLATIKMAERFKDEERIYFPCNMDFRGRVYPIPTFSFQGDSINKSLIKFADAEAITDEKALKWIYVHGANLAGIDKVSYSERIAWVKTHQQAILDAANDPLGNTWWYQVDSPFEFLAFCFEFKRLSEYISENGSCIGFKSTLAIAFDGTCSGLQHFSAILRDSVGGKAVNLVPGDKPSDIYGVVAEKVNEMLNHDSIHGTADTTKENKNGEIVPKLGTKTLAQLWLSFGVNRKVTKRPTMTLAYGAKKYGFREQVLEDTIEEDINNGGCLFTMSNKYQAASYMSTLIWEAVGKTVIKAVEAMHWLQTAASLVAGKGKVITWVTPMGLPVQQNYTKHKSVRVSTRIHNRMVNFYDQVDTGEIDKRGQANGVAPNFIHSMDASHLQMTVCNCLNEGIHHFAMIHDSYATSPAHAEDMYRIVRQSFIKMYTEHDVLNDFKDSLELFNDIKIETPPAKGDLNLDIVADSEYIFS